MRIRDTHKEELVKKNAMKLIVKDGLKGFTMQKLADKCGISVATLYIYYKDKDDLIHQLGHECSVAFTREALKGFSPEMNFKEGLYLQWENRLRYTLDYRLEQQFYEILRHSPYADSVLAVSTEEFRNVMRRFVTKAIDEGHLMKLPIEVFWSIAFGPLYNLIKFHLEKKSIGNRDYTLSRADMDTAFQMVIKALTP